jgi:lipopolysaccharide transport system ATP-binding protein
LSNLAIRVEGLSKCYRIGERAGYVTLRDTLTTTIRHALNVFRDQKKGKSKANNNYIWALKDASFNVNRGEILGIIGDNGAGKTTLLKILSRITEPTKGYAEIFGSVGSLLEVGTGFHPELTGRENIYLNGAILGMKKVEIDRKFDEFVAFAEIEKFIDTPVKRYSSGMYVRLAFSVAAHLEPEIMMVDEVLAVGDAAFQKKCLGKMGDVAKDGRTVLFVSHNMGAINTLCDRAILIDAGTIVEDGSPQEVIKNYLSRGVVNRGHITWSEKERPGNQAFRLVSVSLKTAQGISTSQINISEDATVKIDYEVLREGARIQLALMLFDVNGNCVFSSLSNTEENVYHDRPFQKGQYVSECRIYGNLLNNGEYYLTIKGTSGSWRDRFTINNVISFEAVDDGTLKRDYWGNYRGIIRPKLTWKTSSLEKNDYANGDAKVRS